MGSIRVQNVRKQFNEKIVLMNISLDLVSGEVVGLVGANGSGKTTLLRMLSGDLEPDLGTVTKSKGMDIGYLSQEPAVDPERTLHDEVGSAFDDLMLMERQIHDVSDQLAAKHGGDELHELMSRYDKLTARFEAAGGYGFVQRMNEVLGGLGFSQADHTLKVGSLSGGQKCRAALAKLLLRDNSFLLLDEPTNHLDIDAVRWLEKFMAAHHGGAVIVSHDRYLLDRLVDRIVEVDRMGIMNYPGNYTNYVQSKELRKLTLERQFVKDQAFIEKERAFIAKHLAGQRTKEAQGRRARLERRIKDGEFVMEVVHDRKATKLKFDSEAPRDGTALRVDDLAKAYDGKRLFDALRFQIQQRERFGITGPNGTGKSTLLKILRDEVAADAGTFAFGPKLSVGYYAQEAADLDPATTLVEQIRMVREDFSEHEARSWLGRFRFSGEDVFKSVALLSGGEQSRLRLAKLILSCPNLLILDEPTNHLDIDSCEALESALSDFPGTILVVSHDRYFLDRMVRRLLVIRAEGHRLFSGNYSEYQAALEEERAAAEAAEANARTGKRKGRGKGQTGGGTEGRKARSEFDRYSVEELEAYIEEREGMVSELNERFTDERVYRDPEALERLRAELAAVHAELGAAEAAWSERGDE